MEIDLIKKAHNKVRDLEIVQEKIKDLEKSDDVSFVRIEHTGSYNRYEVIVRNDEVFLKTLKTLIKDKLKRDEQRLIKYLKNL